VNNPISVVIPTYNNRAILAKCLAQLARQTHPLDQMEVVVIVDGSKDDTVAFLAEYKNVAPFPFVYEYQENAGPGPARNRGIRKATHDVVLIINDDFLMEPQTVAAHASWHAAHPAREYALLGFVEEPAGNGVDFNMSRLDKAFNSVRHKTQLDWHNFWTTNISVKRSFLVESGEWFSNRFPHPVHEDIEMGYRLGKRGLKLFMEPSARGLHDHVMNYEQFARRAYQSGVCLAMFYKLHPELKDFLISRGLISTRVRQLRPVKSAAAEAILNEWNLKFFERVARFLCRRRQKVLANFLFNRLFGYHQRRGVNAGLEKFIFSGGDAKSPLEKPCLN
jgi:glycosyltransferase involved in cell wall biosynthesis